MVEDVGPGGAGTGGVLDTGPPVGKNREVAPADRGGLQPDDSGIRAAVRTALFMFESAMRRSGRTRRMIAALPDDAVVLTTHQPSWLQKEIHRLRPELRGVLAVQTAHGLVREHIHEAAQRYRGRAIVLDHTAILQLYEDQIEDGFKVLDELKLRTAAVSAGPGDHPPSATLLMDRDEIRGARRG